MHIAQASSRISGNQLIVASDQPAQVFIACNLSQIKKPLVMLLSPAHKITQS